MKLYDETISRVLSLLSEYPSRELPMGETKWPEITDNSMILRSDMAFELGAEPFPGMGLTIMTDDAALVPCDGVHLIGPDLPQMKKAGAYARIALVRVKEETLGEGNALYKAIRNLEYTRYHFYPDGFMMRVSAAKKRETVRIGLRALRKGLNFGITGNRMISAFKKHPAVEAVSIWYVSTEDFDFKRLRKEADDAEKITKTIDHMMKNVIMDCGVCSLQKICDEVEGLRALHFPGK